MKPSSPDVMRVLDAARMRPARARGAGRAIMFMSARRGEGVTTAVRAALLSAGPAAAYAIDLDLHRNALARAFSDGAPLGPRIPGRLGGHLFYEMRLADGRPWLEFRPAFFFHRIGRTRAYVSAFDSSEIPAGGKLLISDKLDYWDAARGGGATVIVDAPALERARIGLRVARHMDGVVLVVGSDEGAAPAAMAAKSEILAAGGQLLGIVYTHATPILMAAQRLWRQAG
ncbi:MAG: hypothetical protein ABUS48_01145 [Pseudomonadota bacterium]